MAKITKSMGINESEKYLSELCEKSFLSLWSYPNLFKQPGKELCDLMVVFGNDIIIFSDKDCTFPDKGELKTNWDTWFKKTITESSKQAWGAERWMKKYPKSIFLDAKCKEVFPYELPDMKLAKFHLVLVAHQASQVCKEAYGGSGSLMITNDDDFAKAPGMPFVIGDVDKSKTFVHVFDDVTLDVIMKNVDTVTDFVKYLTKKEAFFRSSVKIVATGEEDLLAYYLTNTNNQGEHDFVLHDERADMIVLDESIWKGFEKNPQRIAQKKADETSYFWDSIIESFSRQALSGAQYFTQGDGFQSSEKILRFLAKASRFERRMLSNSFIDILRATPRNKRMLRVGAPIKNGDPYYVFLLFPWRSDKSEEVNRKVRRLFLETCCRVVKLCYKDAEDIVGIATESGRGESGSEDAAYFNARIWTKEMEEEAKKAQEELGILLNPTIRRVHDDEYPEELDISKNPRNKLCPCKSGKKYKKCHGG